MYCALQFFKLPSLWNEARYGKKAKIKFIDLLKIERFYLVIFLRISLRFKVTGVQKNWSAQYFID